MNVGDAGTAHSDGDNWKDEAVITALRRFVRQGGGFIGVGEPSARQYQGHYLQLAGLLVVAMETGLTFGYSKYNWEERDQFYHGGLRQEYRFWAEKE